MPVYIKTDTDDALINAIEISNNGNFVFSASTFPNQKDSKLLSLGDGTIDACGAGTILPWEPDSSVVCDLSDNTIEDNEIKNNKDLAAELQRSTGSHDLQQFGEYISSTRETNCSQKMIHVMAKIISTTSFVALGHPKD
jgi:parallel beta-helix repeat protein